MTAEPDESSRGEQRVTQSRLERSEERVFAATCRHLEESIRNRRSLSDTHSALIPVSDAVLAHRTWSPRVPHPHMMRRREIEYPEPVYRRGLGASDGPAVRRCVHPGLRGLGERVDALSSARDLAGPQRACELGAAHTPSAEFRRPRHSSERTQHGNGADEGHRSILPAPRLRLRPRRLEVGTTCGVRFRCRDATPRSAMPKPRPSGPAVACRQATRGQQSRWSGFWQWQWQRASDHPKRPET